MKGSKCKCGFMTVAVKNRCPRCGKEMKPEEWPDEGVVLSYSKLGVMPQGLNVPMDLVLVEVPKGPKVICWTANKVKAGDELVIVEQDGQYFCRPKPDLTFELDEDFLTT